LQISTRYLQRLLETSGTSFTAHVTELRLNHAFALLIAQGKSDVLICDVALHNRLFRCRFGDTPKGVRSHARMGNGIGHLRMNSVMARSR
jgi:transcriptional regulator GlxA family with amidase domain